MMKDLVLLRLGPLRLGKILRGHAEGNQPPKYPATQNIPTSPSIHGGEESIVRR
jgi:hypothetical protein